MTKKKKTAKQKPESVEPKIPLLYNMPPPNDDIFGWGGDLRNCRVPIDDDGRSPQPGRPIYHVADGPTGAGYEWVDPRYLQDVFDSNEALQTALSKALQSIKRNDKLSTQAANTLKEAMDTAFLDDYIVRVIQQYDKVKSLILRFLLAQAAYRDRQGDLRKKKLIPPKEEDDVY